MGKFDLRKYDVNPLVTRDFEITEIEGEPILTGRVVGEKNRALFKKIQSRGAAGRRGTPLTPGEIQVRARKNARELFAGDCITTWAKRPPLDTDGNPVEFSVEACKEFLAALPDHLIDRLIGFFADADNFTDAAQVTPGDAEAVAGN